MNHLDLFSGIGGFALAARWVGGINTIAFCEINPFCQQVLRKNFPKIKIYEDIRTLKKENIEERIDIITGGYPCQPFSSAGRRRGEADPRHLWPEMYRLIRECRPTYVLCENVYGHISLGLDQVLSDLESEGYATESFAVPALAVGAPHQRQRVWVVTYPKHNGRAAAEVGQCIEKRNDGTKERPQELRRSSRPDLSLAAHDNSERVQGVHEVHQGGSEPQHQLARGLLDAWGCETWVEAATRLCRVDDGLSVALDGFKLSQAGHRRERIIGLGNAIVPQVAYQFLKTIKQIEKHNKETI